MMYRRDSIASTREGLWRTIRIKKKPLLLRALKDLTAFVKDLAFASGFVVVAGAIFYEPRQIGGQHQVKIAFWVLFLIGWLIVCATSWEISRK